MFCIKPLNRLTRAEVLELARSAAERGDPNANPFETGTDQYEWFELEYQELQAA